MSDWTGATYQDRRYMAKYQSQYGAGGTQYAYYHDEDETERMNKRGPAANDDDGAEDN